MNKLKTYKNGNYTVEIYEDGTKYRLGKIGRELKPRFPESIDLKITNYCDMGCSMCHENSTTKGKHGNFNSKFLLTLKPGTELAIGGGNPLDHPELEEFLASMKTRGVICNMTVHQKHFMQNTSTIFKYMESGFITSLGISLYDSNDKEFIGTAKAMKNTVIHVINGLFTENDFNNLKDNGLNMLILGYKIFGRGVIRYGKDVEENMAYLKDNIDNMRGHFPIISFDNLAIEQLDMKRFFSGKDWNSYFMGGDGLFTMYIDLVKEEFAKSSTSTKRFEIKNNINKMFKIIRKKTLKKEV